MDERSMKLRYKLRTLLLLMAILPPLLAVVWWNYAAWKEEQDKKRAEAAAGANKFIQNQLQLLRFPPVLAPATPAARAAEEAALEAQRQASQRSIEELRRRLKVGARLEEIPEAERMQRRGHPIFPAIREI
jgi:4-amino-4-deoxy-L-arabinose transferase-like glycosyltransferase